MAIDWNMLKFKEKFVDKARYIFTNYIDITKGLDALYSLPEYTLNSPTVIKSFDFCYISSPADGDHVIAWELPADSTTIKKLYIYCEAYTANESRIHIADSSLLNGFLFGICPSASAADYQVHLKSNGSYTVLASGGGDIASGWHTFELTIDFVNKTLTFTPDNWAVPWIINPSTFPTFDKITVGFRVYTSGYNAKYRNLIVTWE